jgi:ketosteroid isomerase-like protein
MPAIAPPTRWLLILAGVLTQLVGLSCLVLGLASLPILHDLHAGTGALIASIIAALATVICGTLVWRGRLIPLALAAGLDVGFGIGLPRGSSAISALLRMLPKDEVATADALVTAGAIAMFVAAIVCVLAIPSALKLRNWARGEIEREARAAIGADGERAKRTSSPNPASSTLRGVGETKLMPTQVLRVGPRSKPAIIIGVAVSLIAIGIVVISAATGSSKDEAIKIATGSGSGSAAKNSGSGSGSATSPVAVVTTTGSGSGSGSGSATPTIDAGPEQPAVEDLVTRFHAALAHAKADELGLVIDAKAFAFGVEAHEIAEGRDAVVAMLRHDLGTPSGKGFDVASRFAQVAHDGDVAWVAEELKVGTKTFVTTYAAGLRDGAWTIAALHFAQTVPNETAYRLAREGELPLPDAIPDSHDDSPLAQAMRTGFASKPSFVAARSARPESINFGSGPNERVGGGENIKKLFARIKATVRLPGAVKVGTIGERGGWGAANVEFTDADRDGTDVTQTFRVLAVWLKEDASWRMVQTQWSNPK